MLRGSLCTLVLCVFSATAFGFETDNFTRRYEPLSDARASLNAEVNRHLRSVVARLNRQGMWACNDMLAHDAAREALAGSAGGLIGVLESFAAKSDTVPKHKPPSPHIYSSRPLREKLNAFIATIAGVQVSVNINGHYVGADKFGHFFDDGRFAYSVYRQDRNVRKSLSEAIRLENDIYGMKSTGIYSYADIAAENDGRRFWANLTDGDKPYFKCDEQTNKWSLAREFDWADYVSAAWDEGNNCSNFTPATAAAVQKRASELEKEAKAAGREESYTCPVNPAKCVGLKDKYEGVADIVLHPKCLNAKAPAASAKSSAKTPARPAKPENKPATSRRAIQ